MGVGALDPDRFAQRIKDLFADPLELGRALGYKGTPDGRKQFGAFHEEMLEHRNSQPKTSTVCSRGHAKSTVELICNIHTKITRPDSRILVGSSTLDLGKKLLGEMRDRMGGDIELFEGYYVPMRDLFPWAFPRFHQGQVSGPCDKFNIIGRAGQGREPCFMTASPGMNLAGNHPTHASIDDPANEQNSNTEMRRQQVIDFIHQLVPIMYEKNSPVKHIGTPWAFSDVSAYLSEAPEWSQYRYGVWDGANEATGEKDGKGPGPGGSYPLCSSFLTAEEIYAIQANNPKSFFAMQYECRPVAGEDALFEDDMFVQATAGQLSGENLPEGYDIMLVDPVAVTEGYSADLNGVLVVRVVPAAVLGIATLPPDHNVFIPHYAAEIRGNVDSLIQHIEHLIEKDRFPNLRSIWIENVVFSGTIKPWLIERGRLEGVRVRTQRIPQKNLATRLKGVPTALRKGIIQFPARFEGRDKLIKRLIEFPMSSSDDLPAALALLGSHLSRRGQLPFENGAKANEDWATGPSANLPDADFDFFDE